MVDVAVLVGSETLVAVITALPADTPVTRPELLTVATPGVALDHVTFWPAPPGNTLAVSWRVVLTATEAVVGATTTLVTATNGTRVIVGEILETV